MQGSERNPVLNNSMKVLSVVLSGSILAVLALGICSWWMAVDCRAQDVPQSMNQPPPSSVFAARTRLGLNDSVPARVYRVRRLDAPAEAYHLIIFGPTGGTVGAATIHATTGALQNSARLPGTQEQLEVDANEAKSIAGLGDDASAELVWAPSRASRSPFLPLWEVRGANDTIRYVDQQRRIVPPTDLTETERPE